jgi:phosphotransferase system HPr (HPr) family protein
VKKRLKFPDDMGMHIRLASTIAMVASHHPGLVTIVYRDDSYNAKSILGLSSSRIAPGNDFELIVEGDGADELITRLEHIIYCHADPTTG